MKFKILIGLLVVAVAVAIPLLFSDDTEISSTQVVAEPPQKQISELDKKQIEAEKALQELLQHIENETLELETRKEELLQNVDAINSELEELRNKAASFQLAPEPSE